jgi:hypothetical protein
MWSGKHYWDGGFENEFSVFPTKKALQAEIKRSESLTWVVRTIITSDKGVILYDEQKESPNATKPGSAEASKDTQGKKASSKASRIADESKRRVCRPQDI